MNRINTALALSTVLLLSSFGCQSTPRERAESNQKQREKQATDQNQTSTEETFSDADELGAVDFETSCNDGAQEAFEVGLARLHHMWYSRARKAFETAAERDDRCAMAHWGVAMTYYTPLWAPPSKSDLETGKKWASKAAELGGDNPREKAFIETTTAFFEKAPGERSLDERVEAFKNAWTSAYERDSDDVEATAFHSLAQLAGAPADAGSYETQKRVGKILEALLEKNPNHPGGFHYLIHAYDYPELAEDALPYAKKYKEIAPSVPHALHMPSHIFTRQGMWNDVIELNKRSAKAALKHRVDGHVSLHYYHAIDYSVYAGMQTGREKYAKKLADEFEAQTPPQPHLATAYASVAVPARLAVERRKWAEATELEPAHPNGLDWKKWPFARGIVHAVRAIGASQTDDLEGARDELAEAESARKASAEVGPAYWTNQLEIYIELAQAFVDYEEGNTESALEKVRTAAKQQNSIGKHPVMPGDILPVQEFLGDFLLREENSEAALEAYERALERSANRFRSLYGAATAAKLGGDDERAKKYYGDLVALSEKSDTERPEVREAKQFLNGD